MRLAIYILSGIAFASLGWNLGQFFIDSFGWFKLFPELALSSCVAASLSAGMVLTDIFLSNPTRPKLNLLRLGTPVATAAGLGFGIGLLAGGISQFLLIPQIRDFLFFLGSAPFVRIIRWMIVGLAVGLAEGWTWRWRSVESGKKRRSQQRLKTNAIAGMAAGSVAAILFEFLRLLFRSSIEQIKEDFQREWGFSILGFESFVGVLLLGAALGAAFREATSPSYVAALRAGAGFEFSAYNQEPAKINKQKPIKVKDENNNSQDSDSGLEFVSNEFLDKIEEGLSIQLPERGTITIGSATGVHICIPGLPAHVADLDLEERRALLKPNSRYYRSIEVNGERLSSNNPVFLKHNSILTFCCDQESRKDGKRIFRFVYYNRFLDPQG